MQQTFGLKRFVNTHVWATALVIGGLLVGTLSVAGLAATGNLSSESGNDSQREVSQPEVARSAQGDFADRRGRLLDATTARRETAAIRTAQLETAQRFYAHKEARQEQAELYGSAMLERAAQQDILRRYVEHKERTLDALP